MDLQGYVRHSLAGFGDEFLGFGNQAANAVHIHARVHGSRRRVAMDRGGVEQQ